MNKFIACCCLIFPITALAWVPEKPISVVIGYSPGSTNDVIFRKAAQIVSKNNPGVTFVIQSRPGAASVIANNYLALQPADGYSIGIPSTTTTVVANDIWQKNVMKYQWQDFSIPIILGETTLALTASSTSPINTFKQFNELIKNPTRNINIATAGGTQTLAYYYLLAETQQSDHYAEIRHGNSDLVAIAVASGQTEFGVTTINSAESLASSGKLKILKSPHFSISNGYMIILPAKTPANIVRWYETEFGKAIQDTTFQAWAAVNYIDVNTKLSSESRVREYLMSIKNKFSKTTPK